jgi:hypothetical protein
MSSGREHRSNGPNLTVHREKVDAGESTYTLEVIETSEGKKFLSITEGTVPDSGQALKRIIIHEPHLQPYHEGYFRSILQFDPPPKAFRVDEVRKQFPNAYLPWQPEDDALL